MFCPTCGTPTQLPEQNFCKACGLNLTLVTSALQASPGPSGAGSDMAAAVAGQLASLQHSKDRLWRTKLRRAEWGLVVGGPLLSAALGISASVLEHISHWLARFVVSFSGFGGLMFCRHPPARVCTHGVQAGTASAGRHRSDASARSAGECRCATFRHFRRRDTLPGSLPGAANRCRAAQCDRAHDATAQRSLSVLAQGIGPRHRTDRLRVSKTGGFFRKPFQ